MSIEILGFVGKLSTEKVTLSVSYVFCFVHVYGCLLYVYYISNERHITLKRFLHADIISLKLQEKMATFLKFLSGQFNNVWPEKTVK